MGSQNHHKIIKNLVLVPQVSFLLLPWSPNGSASRQNGPEGAKVEAPGLPNGRFWTPKIAIPMSKETAMNRNSTKTNLQMPTSLRTFHKKTAKFKTQRTSKFSKTAELAQHSQHHTALFPRVRAGDRGRCP